jgi:hypothetical protein
MTPQGQVRIQQLERENVERDLRLASVERQEAIKVAMDAKALEQENQRLHEDCHEEKKRNKAAENR